METPSSPENFVQDHMVITQYAEFSLEIWGMTTVVIEIIFSTFNV